MTKKHLSPAIDPTSLSEAARRITEAVGAKRLAHLTGLGESTVYHFGEGGDDRLPTMGKAVLMDKAFVDKTNSNLAPFLAAYKAHLADLTEGQVGDFDVESEFLDLSSCIGNLAGRLREYRSDASSGGNTLTMGERKSLLRICEDVEREVAELARALKSELVELD